MRVFLLGIFIMSVCMLRASSYQADIIALQDTLDAIQTEQAFQIADNTNFKPKHRKLKAVLLAIFLGHFGVHRIYLGTSPNVPVVYSLTLGGGLGLLPLIDIIAILKSENLDEFKDSKRVFMWQKPPSSTLR